jgi:hypothetical protein
VPESTQEKDERIQEQILKNAQSVENVYQPKNFLSRKSINNWTKRMDTPDKLWYIYLMTDSGAFIGYHICKTVPLSYGVGLTSPVREYNTSGQGANPLGAAPGVDGVYYTGTDPSVHFCFDAETDAMIVFNQKFVYYDKPLNLDAPRLILKKEKE